MIRVLLVLILLSSCSSNVKVFSGGCKETNLSSAEGIEEIKISSFSIGIDHQINLKDELLKNDIRCENQTFHSIKVKKSWLDSLIGFLPFVSQRTIIISY